ncbi:DUF302 domain-containing protein [Rhizobium oryzihabitans]|uniref:DUF302 domain-containing protein n=1 Tax=Rhizobium oryzihabitans TaxID=2267833 RepID=UPI003CCCE8B0
MTYTLDKTTNGIPFDQVVAATKAALASNGFGVLTEIDVRATMNKKLDVDIPDYLILGACNPKMALEAMKIEPKVGAMLPCNVIVRSLEGAPSWSAPSTRGLDAGYRKPATEDGRGARAVFA